MRNKPRSVISNSEDTDSSRSNMSEILAGEEHNILANRKCKGVAKILSS